MELDTDGIWCLLPSLFPQKYSFHVKSSGKELRFEFPTTVLNLDVHRTCTNDQYLQFDAKTRRFERESRNEIYFELDGPWRAMFLPASEKSDDLLKKRSAPSSSQARRFASSSWAERRHDRESESERERDALLCEGLPGVFSDTSCTPPTALSRS